MSVFPSIVIRFLLQLPWSSVHTILTPVNAEKLHLRLWFKKCFRFEMGSQGKLSWSYNTQASHCLVGIHLLQCFYLFVFLVIQHWIAVVINSLQRNHISRKLCSRPWRSVKVSYCENLGKNILKGKLAAFCKRSAIWKRTYLPARQHHRKWSQSDTQVASKQLRSRPGSVTRSMQSLCRYSYVAFQEKQR